MADSDEDAPPPLSSLADQLEALRVRNEGTASTSGGDGTLPAASIVIIEPKAPPVVKAAAIKKGFFDAKPSKPKAKAPAVPPVKKASGDDEELVIDLTGLRRPSQQPGSFGGPNVPDFMMLPPDEEAAKYALYKEQLVDALKPTSDTLEQVTKDATLLAGFDDPEVMRAVADIAANPQNFKKYQKNEKVLRFYSSMGKVMGDKLAKMGAAAPTKPE